VFWETLDPAVTSLAEAATGQGRPKGSKTDRTKAVAVELALTGSTPLEVMMQAMRYYMDVHADTGASASARSTALDKATGMAKDAAPYMHPRLAAVAVGTAQGQQAEQRDISMAELARRIAFIFRESAREGQVIEAVEYQEVKPSAVG
jgi:hypothetical protein